MQAYGLRSKVMGAAVKDPGTPDPGTPRSNPDETELMPPSGLEMVDRTGAATSMRLTEEQEAVRAKVEHETATQLTDREWKLTTARLQG